MATPGKRKVDQDATAPATSSRVTPPKAKRAEAAATRYTAPTVAARKGPSPRWVPVLMFGLFILLALLFCAAFAPWLAPHDPYLPDLTARLTAPGAEFWLGSDELGRDILSRVIYGSRLTLLIVGLVIVTSAPGMANAEMGAVTPFEPWPPPRVHPSRASNRGSRLVFQMNASST